MNEPVWFGPDKTEHRTGEQHEEARGCALSLCSVQGPLAPASLVKTLSPKPYMSGLLR